MRRTMKETAMSRREVLAGGAAAFAAMTAGLAGCAGTTSRPQAAGSGPPKPQITVLYDAFGKAAAMQKDWGYAALIESSGKRILFDTGNNGDILAQNAKAKGIDLSTLDFVVMSHRHGDHMGGLAYLLRVNPPVKIYAPKEGFGVYGADLPSTFYRKDDSLLPQERYYDGAPPSRRRAGSAWLRRRRSPRSSRWGHSAPGNARRIPRSPAPGRRRAPPTRRALPPPASLRPPRER